ncbi:hypothetical protein A11A3_11698 [Alcanivorax hongdengensis A-11-3]|uniref:Uncharacterized protein n=1 Tax=Alcanivorax hongdengensis A-11-3 TaxID=1177179 RepID=L0WA73_9GAMM|nr:hypothetical protein [Alcanivorax hongdengensis]EKF73871.1 hypothetical protein A11A3_11698 [Alcanivorax hongdengensis A-11-3]
MRAARQTGQSMVGFLVASMFILIPAFIGLSFLAKTGDMKFRADEASRYSAWEKTVWDGGEGHAKGDLELGWEVRNRVFGRAEGLVDSRHDKTRQENQGLDAMAYTTYAERRGREVMLADLAESNSGVQVNTSHLAYGGVLARLNNRAADVLKLRDDGYQKASVEVALTKPSAEYLPVESFTLKTRYVLLDDAWSAAAPDIATENIRRTVPTSLLDNDVIRTMQSIVGFVFDDLDPRNFELGKVDVSVAPCQRLAPYERGNTDAPDAC